MDCDDMVPDMLSNKKLYLIETELFIKLLNFLYYFTEKIPNQQDF